MESIECPPETDSQCDQLKRNVENTMLQCISLKEDCCINDHNQIHDPTENGIGENKSPGTSIENVEKIYLEEIVRKLENANKDLEQKLEQALSNQEKALKERESIVVRYATSEKNMMKEIQNKEIAIKRYKEMEKENEILSAKHQRMLLEKERISDMYHNKCYELKNSQQELDKTKLFLNEIQIHINQLQEHKHELEISDADEIKNVAKESIRRLTSQLQEQQASIILLKHEIEDKGHDIFHLKTTINSLRETQNTVTTQNDDLLQKIKQLEQENKDICLKNEDLKKINENDKMKVTEFQIQLDEIEELKQKLQRQKDFALDANVEISNLKTSNEDLQKDVDRLRVRENELLIFTKQVTERIVEFQSQFNFMELKTEQLSLEGNLLKRQIKKQVQTINHLSQKVSDEQQNVKVLSNTLEIKERLCERNRLEIENLKTDYLLSKQKLNKTIKETMNELRRLKKENYKQDKPEYGVVNKLNGDTSSVSNTQKLGELDDISVRKSERIHALEGHLKQLQTMLQKKTKIIQYYILREQERSGSNNTDEEKAKLSALKMIIKSNMSFSMDVRKKLQNALEDALYENIILKESVDTLGKEIARLSN